MVVVAAEPVEQLLQVGQISCRALPGKPGLERLVDTLELAERLRVVATGVDRLDSQLAKTVLELELDAVEASAPRQEGAASSVGSHRERAAVPVRHDAPARYPWHL